MFVGRSDVRPTIPVRGRHGFPIYRVFARDAASSDRAAALVARAGCLAAGWLVVESVVGGLAVGRAGKSDIALLTMLMLAVPALAVSLAAAVVRQFQLFCPPLNTVSRAESPGGPSWENRPVRPANSTARKQSHQDSEPFAASLRAARLPDEL